MMSRIIAHNRLRDGSLKNATCARGTALYSSVDSARFLAFTRQRRRCAAFNEANKSAMLRSEWTITGHRGLTLSLLVTWD